MKKRFPILQTGLSRQQLLDCPTDVPWDFIQPHESQAKRNHSQSLETLARRGGLGPLELYAVVRGVAWNYAIRDLSMGEEEAIDILNKWLEGEG